MIETTYEYGVAMVTMRHGKVTALDTVLCQALCGEVDHAVADGAQAVVLTGTGTVFSAGVDLHRVIAGRDAYLASFLPELRKVFTAWPPLVGVPFPAIALDCMVTRSGAARRARAQVRRAGSGGCVRVSSPPSG